MSDKVKKLIRAALRNTSAKTIQEEAEKFLQNYPSITIEDLANTYTRATIVLEEICKIFGDEYLRIMGGD